VVAAMIEIVIATIPLLLLLGSLLFGYYPGCETIVRLAERVGSSGARVRRATRSRRPRPPASHAASGGLLIAFGLAQRPPPLAP
jgi:hypothetical protein